MKFSLSTALKLLYRLLCRVLEVKHESGQNIDHLSAAATILRTRTTGKSGMYWVISDQHHQFDMKLTFKIHPVLFIESNNFFVDQYLHAALTGMVRDTDFN